MFVFFNSADQPMFRFRHLDSIAHPRSVVHRLFGQSLIWFKEWKCFHSSSSFIQIVSFFACIQFWRRPFYDLARNHFVSLFLFFNDQLSYETFDSHRFSCSMFHVYFEIGRDTARPSSGDQPSIRAFKDSGLTKNSSQITFRSDAEKRGCGSTDEKWTSLEMVEE